MAKISEWFLLLLSLATMASIDAEDPRLAKDGEQARTEGVYALLRAMRARSLLAWSTQAGSGDILAPCAIMCGTVVLKNAPDRIVTIL